MTFQVTLGYMTYSITFTRTMSYQEHCPTCIYICKCRKDILGLSHPSLGLQGMKAAYHLKHMGGVQGGCRRQAEAILSWDIREAICSAGLYEDTSKETTSLRL